MSNLKFRIIFIFLGCAAAFGSVVSGQDIYPPDQPRYEHTDIALGVFELPEKGAYFSDPDFGTEIQRITDPNVGDWIPKHDYSKIQPFNADGTLFRFSSVALYDARTLELVQELPNLYRAIWSNTDPDILFGFKQVERQILRYHVSTGMTDVLVDLSADPDCEYMDLGPGEGNIDAEDQYVALVCRRSEDLTVITLNLVSGEEVARRSFPGAWYGGGDMIDMVDWVSVSQSGAFTLILWDAAEASDTNPYTGDGGEHYGVEVYDTQTLNFQRRLWHYGNHGDLCVDTDGEEVYVQFNGPSLSYVNSYRLSDGFHRSIINEDQNPDGDIRQDFRNHGGHLSCRNLKRPGWAYFSLEHNSDLPDEFINDGEILAVRLDGSGVVEHFAFHRSSAESYQSSPMPVPSPDGSRVMYTSDWEGSGNPDLSWEFIVGQNLSRIFSDGFETGSMENWAG